MTTNRKSRRKGLLTGLASLTAVSAIAVGSFAAFSSSDTATQEINTGSGAIVFNAAGRASIETPINNLLPGQQVIKTFVIENSATFRWSSVLLEVDGGGLSLLTTAANYDSPQVFVQECSVPYVGPTCFFPAAQTTLINGDFASANPSATNNVRLTSATPGLDGYYKVTLSLDTLASNATQGLSDTITYTFTANQ